MDGQRFDAVARLLATRQTRRGTLRRLVAATGALMAAAIPGRSKAGYNCDYVGCGCATGTLHPCSNGLVCCASTPGMPGGAGVARTRVTATGYVLAGENTARTPAIGATLARRAAPATAATTGAVPEPD